MLSLKHGKKKSAIFLFWRDCFASLAGWKVTPSGLYCRYLISRLTKSIDLDGLVRASSMAVLRVRSCRDKLSLLPSDTKYDVTLDTSRVEEYLGCGGLS